MVGSREENGGQSEYESITALDAHSIERCRGSAVAGLLFLEKRVRVRVVGERVARQGAQGCSADTANTANTVCESVGFNLLFFSAAVAVADGSVSWRRFGFLSRRRHLEKLERKKERKKEELVSLIPIDISSLSFTALMMSDWSLLPRMV